MIDSSEIQRQQAAGVPSWLPSLQCNRELVQLQFRALSHSPPSSLAESHLQHISAEMHCAANVQAFIIFITDQSLTQNNKGKLGCVLDQRGGKQIFFHHELLELLQLYKQYKDEDVSFFMKHI